MKLTPLSSLTILICLVSIGCDRAPKPMESQWHWESGISMDLTFEYFEDGDATVLAAVENKGTTVFRVTKIDIELHTEEGTTIAKVTGQPPREEQHLRPGEGFRQTFDLEISEGRAKRLAAMEPSIWGGLVTPPWLKSATKQAGCDVLHPDDENVREACYVGFETGGGGRSEDAGDLCLKELGGIVVEGVRYYDVDQAFAAPTARGLGTFNSTWKALTPRMEACRQGWHTAHECWVSHPNTYFGGHGQ